jgi:acetyltransferase-like isoleucine patch superfamily enzyme
MFEKILFLYPISLKSVFRKLLFRIVGMRIGKNNRFEGGRVRRATHIRIGDDNAFTSGYWLWPSDSDSSGKIIIGNHNYFNKGLMIDSCGEISIGNYNMFGPDIYITDSDHGFGKEISPSEAPMVRGKVKIGNHCWLGAKVVILKNVTLGDHCVVAAGSVVTKSFGSGSLIAGVPARLIRDLNL